MKNWLICIFALAMSSCSVVGPGEKGVSVFMGEVQQNTKDSGWYLWVPFVRSVKTISIRVQKSEVESEASSKDLQKVFAKVALNWHVDPSTVGKLLQDIGDENDVVERAIMPAVNEVMKAATAQMTAEEILTKRIELKKSIDEALIDRLKKYNVLIDDVSLVNLHFTPEFDHAVEQKQVSEQQAKQAQYVAQKATQDAIAAVNRAKGQAEAALVVAKAQAESQRLLKANLTKENLQLEWIKKWNGDVPSVLTGNSSGMIFNLPGSKPSKKFEE
jgi:regulator of protease activity HflC (stomatin/prohibitin superfamily)